MAEGKQHRYAAVVTWTGNTGKGTADYRAYERAHDITVAGKPAILASSDPAFRGDATRYNPEDLLVASLSACHMLWYLSLCAMAKVVVTAYVDEAEGVMEQDAAGGGRFTAVTLRPRVTITASSDLEKARALHHEAHAKCFIAKSVNFPVNAEPTIERK